MTRLTLLAGVAAGALALMPASYALAEEPEAIAGDRLIWLEGGISVEIQNDGVISSDDKTAELNDLFATIEGGFDLHLTRYFQIHTDLVFEPVQDPGPGDSRFFEDHGLYAETLFAQVNLDPVTLVLGKFNPTFGIAWDAAPGIYGADFAEDYELTERIGAGFAFEFGSENSGQHVLAASAFFQDTTGFSDSIITKRGRTRKQDGGASNTEDLSSFSVTLDGGEFQAIENLTYHLGFRYQKAGTGNVDDETGVVAGLVKGFELGEDEAIEAIVEAAYFDNFDVGDNNAFYLTVGGAYTTGPWNASLSYTLRDLSGGPVGTNATDHLFQASVGREVWEGVTMDVGYKFARESDVDSHTIGVLFAREFDVNL